MSDRTAISWSDATWNPTTGCDRVSPGCAHCYALDLAARLKKMGAPAYQNDGDPSTSGPGFALTLHPDRLDQPLRWRKPRRIFVNSMSDLFHERVPLTFVHAVFAVMAACHGHTFQVLTKRPERMARWSMDTALLPTYGRQLGLEHVAMTFGVDVSCAPEWPLPNVWLGTSIENDRFVARADALRATPAAVRFISAEPLLGPLPSLNLTGIDWLIVGGESGPGARPMDPGWVVELVDRADAAGVAVWMKQDSGPRSGQQGRLSDELWARKEYPR